MVLRIIRHSCFQRSCVPSSADLAAKLTSLLALQNPNGGTPLLGNKGRAVVMVKLTVDLRSFVSWQTWAMPEGQ